MTLLTADAILAAADLKAEIVEVPEWGGSVRIGVMSGACRDAFMTEVAGGVRLSEYAARLLAKTVLDENNAPLFTKEQIEPLQGKNKDVLDRLLAVANRINGVGATATEEIAKNSDAAPSGVSGSDSPTSTESQSEGSSEK